MEYNSPHGSVLLQKKVPGYSSKGTGEVFHNLPHLVSLFPSISEKKHGDEKNRERGGGVIYTSKRNVSQIVNMGEEGFGKEETEDKKKKKKKVSTPHLDAQKQMGGGAFYMSMPPPPPPPRVPF